MNTEKSLELTNLSQNAQPVTLLFGIKTSFKMNIGLVLSGGGIKGAAHIGVIKALEEHHLHPTYIAGTSAGAIIGALYSYGFSCQEMLQFFRTIQLFHYRKYARNKPGFIDAEKYYNYLKKLLPEDNFDALKKNLFVTATNILEGKLEVFSKGELIKPVLASAAFPGIFSPVEMKGSLYVDGGVLNNFPVDLIRNHCDVVVGVYLNMFQPKFINDLKHFHNVIERSIKIRVAKNDAEKFEDCDIMIAPKNLGQYGLFDKKHVDVIYNIGYNAAKEALSRNEVFLNQVIN